MRKEAETMTEMEEKRPAGGRGGFAMIVAVGVLIVIVLSGIVMQRAAFVELDDVRLAVGRTHARLAASGGYEAGLAEIAAFLESGEAERSIEGTVGENEYRVTLRKVTAGEIGPALAWLPADQSLVALSIEGARKTGPRTYEHRVAAVVDPAKIPYHTVLWMNE